MLEGSLDFAAFDYYFVPVPGGNVQVGGHDLAGGDMIWLPEWPYLKIGEHDLTLEQTWEEFAFQQMYLDLPTYSRAEEFVLTFQDLNTDVFYQPSKLEDHRACRAAFSRFPVTDIEYVENLIFGDWSGSDFAYSRMDRSCDKTVRFREKLQHNIDTSLIATGLLAILDPSLRENPALVKNIVWRFTCTNTPQPHWRSDTLLLKVNPTPPRFLEDLAFVRDHLPFHILFDDRCILGADPLPLALVYDEDAVICLLARGQTIDRIARRLHTSDAETTPLSDEFSSDEIVAKRKRHETMS